MSLKQLLLAMLTLALVASAYAWPTVSQVGQWLLDAGMAWLLSISASL